MTLTKRANSVAFIQRALTSRKAKALLAAAVLPLIASFPAPVHAANLTWDSSEGNAGAPVDGSGNWNTVSANWSNGTVDTGWINGSAAMFGNNGTAGIVTIDDSSGTVSAAGLTFNAVGAGSNYTIAASGGDTLTLTSPTISVVAGVRPTISAPIAGTAGLTLTGAGGLLLSGANTYSGATTVSGGTLTVGAGGTLGATTNSLVLGASTAGSATAVSLDMTNASVTVGSLLVNTNTASANTIVIGAAQTFTIGGNTTFGYTPAVSNATVVPTTTTTFSGGGSLSATAGNFVVGPAGNGIVENVVVDMSGLSNFTYNNASGNFSVATGNQAGGHLTLASANNTITAATILVAGGANGNGGNGSLSFGGGTNSLFYSNNWNIGIDKSWANITFAGANGTLLVRNTDGGSRAGNITIGSRGQSGTVNPGTVVNLNGHSVDILANFLTLGRSTNSSTGNGTFTFDTGTVDVNAIDVADASKGTAVGNLTVAGGTLNVGPFGFFLGNSGGGNVNGTFNVNGGTANVNTSIIAQSTGSGSVTATVNIGGGTLNMNGNNIGTGSPVITVNATAGTLENVGTINTDGGINKTGPGTLIITNTGGFTGNAYTGNTTINGGVVQLGGTNAAQFSTLVVNSENGLAFGSGAGTFNIGGLAGNGSFSLTDTASGPVSLQVTNNNGAAMTYSGAMSGSGNLTLMGNSTLTLSGLNTYTGGTNVSGGTLIVTGSLAASGNVSLASGTSLLGNTASGNSVGSVMMVSGATISPGFTGSPIGTLNLTNLTVQGGTLNFTLGPSATNSQLLMSGLADFTGASTISVTTALSPGVYTLLTAGTLNLGVNPTLSAPSGSSFEYVLDFTHPGEILLDVTGQVVSLTWAGTSSNSWDTSSANWSNGTGLTTYADPDGVSFTDAPGVQTSISLNTTVLPGSVTVNSNTNNYTISGSGGIGGPATAITKSGSSTLALLTANTYSGGTTINGGTVQINSAASLGASPGAVNINAGTLEVLGGSNITTSRNIALGSATSTIQVDGGSVYSVNGVISDGSGAGTLNATGPGTLALFGTNTYTGGTVISGGGTVQINSESSLGDASGNVTINAGTLDATATITSTRNVKLGASTSTIQVDGPNIYTLNGLISDAAGAGTLNKTGAGTVVLGAANSYSGGTVLTAGTVSISADNNLGALPASATPSNLFFNGGSLIASGNMTLSSNRGIGINGTGTIGAATGFTLNYGGDIADSNGSGGLTIGGGGTVYFSGTASYTGATALTGTSVLQIAHGSTLPANTVLNTNNTSQLILGDANGPANITISNLGSSGAQAIPGIVAGPTGLSTVTINYTGGTVATYSRFIGGAGDNQNNITLVFGGTGTFKLNGNPNTYTGGTFINSGTLIASQVGALGDPSSPITLTGGILDLQTNTTVNAYNVSVTGDATIQPDVNSAATAGITQTLGDLSIGANTLTVTPGTVVATGTPKLAFGSVTLSGAANATTTVAPRFNGANTVQAAVVLGSVTGSASAGNTRTLQLDGTTAGNAISGAISDGSNGGKVAVTAAGTGSWTLSGASTYTGGTSISGGTLIANNASALGIGPVAVHTGGSLQLQAGLKVSSLAFDGSTNSWTGALDLANNKLIVDDAVTHATSLANLRNQVGSVITNTGLPANYGIAVVENAALSTPLTMFGGISVGQNSILVSGELLGDANIDGKVDLTDLSTILNNFGTATLAWSSGNFDGAATVNLTDLSFVLNNFGLTNPNANTATAAVAAIATPEPATAVLLAAGTLGLIRRRRRIA